jgi:hypothetical protein
MAILNAMREKDAADKKFAAAIQGIDVGSSYEEEDTDIALLRGTVARDAGFGVGFGLDYVEE